MGLGPGSIGTVLEPQSARACLALRHTEVYAWNLSPLVLGAEAHMELGSTGIVLEPGIVGAGCGHIAQPGARVYRYWPGG